MRLTIKRKNGCLHQFTQKVPNKRGETIEYPKVVGRDRDPETIEDWKWNFTYKELVDGKWRSQCLSVHSSKVAWVQEAIANNYGVDKICEFLADF